MFLLCLALSILGLALGPLLVTLGRGRHGVAAAVDGATLGLIPILLVVRTLPHLYEEIGVAAGLLMLAGYVALLLVERRGHHRGAALGIALVVPAVAAHAFLDGAGLALAFASGAPRSTSLLLGGALASHKLPEGLFFANALLPRIGVRKTFLCVGLLASATVGGALTGRQVLAHLSDAVLHGFVAVGLGFMLRLVVHRHDVDVATARDRRTSALFFLGAAAVALLVPSPHDVLERAQYRELSVAASLGPLLVETAPVILLGVLAGAMIRAALGTGRARAPDEPALATDVSPRGSALAPGDELAPGAPDLRATLAAFLLATELDACAIGFSVTVLGGPLTAAWVAAVLAATTAWRDRGGSPRRRSASTEVPRDVRLRAGLVEAAGTSFDRFAPRYVCGLLAAAALEAALAPALVSRFPESLRTAAEWLVGLAGVGAYAATAGAAVLVHKGLGVQDALTLVVASRLLPLHRLRSMRRIGGPRRVIVYVVLALLVTVAIASLAGRLVSADGMPAIHGLAAHRHDAWEWVCTAVLVTLLFRSFLRRGPRGWFAALGEG